MFVPILFMFLFCTHFVYVTVCTHFVFPLFIFSIFCSVSLVCSPVDCSLSPAVLWFVFVLFYCVFCFCVFVWVSFLLLLIGAGGGVVDEVMVLLHRRLGLFALVVGFLLWWPMLWSGRGGGGCGSRWLWWFVSR
jgi:hypothetical protein